MKMTKSLFAVVATASLLAVSGLWAAESANPANADDLNWMTNYKQAVTAAQKEHKVILMDFTGSDWCGWCMKLDKDVYATPEFKKLAKDKLVLLQLDYPNRKLQSEDLKKQNKDLLEKYKVTGYPTNVFLSSTETELGRIEGYEPKEQWFKSANGILAKGEK